MCADDWLSAAQDKGFVFCNDLSQAIICYQCSHELALCAAVHAVLFRACGGSKIMIGPSDQLAVCMASLQLTFYEICISIYFLSSSDRFSAHLSLW